MTFYFKRSQTGGKGASIFAKGVSAFMKKKRRALRLKRRESIIAVFTNKKV